MEIINSNRENIEGFELPSVWQRWNDQWAGLHGAALQDKKSLISQKTVELKGDIVELRDDLNKEKIELQGILAKYNEQKKNPDINLDKAAEPLKNETFKFSNYSYVPIVYYPIGCIFLLFFIYKKL